MTIPNVCMTWCKRKTKCKWCPEPIETGQPMVRVFFWNKGNPETRRWNRTDFYHPDCWVKQGLDYLELNPFSAKRQGALVQLSKEDKRKRFLLIRRFHALRQRKRIVKAEFPDRLLMESRIDKRMAEIVLEMLKVGGVPKSWAKLMW